MTENKNDKAVAVSKLQPLAQTFEKTYFQQLQSFLGDEKKALSFVSSVDTAIRKTPKLATCTPKSVISSFLKGAELGLMPSEVSGEFYVLPYKNEANFILGYQGLVTLFYRAGIDAITADIIREKDEIEYVNGQIKHKIDIKLSMKERGEPVGAYVAVKVGGGVVAKYMNGKDILAHGERFSPSFKTSFSPWKERNDPELWMWKKTVLRQVAKLLPKSAEKAKINEAIAKDNETEIKYNQEKERLENAKNISKKLSMGNNIKSDDKEKEN